MVVLQRNEIVRNRLICFLTIILSVAAFVVTFSRFSSSSEAAQWGLAVWSLVAAVALILCFVQLYAFPERSHALLLHMGDYMLIATNVLHESFKLRFLRDVLNDSVTALSDEDRAKWKVLEADGYHLAMRIQNPRKILVLRLCTMVYDDVFVIDRSNRWEHHDSSCTADPVSSTREMPHFRSWNGAL
jgi:hypothetical protein